MSLIFTNGCFDILHRGHIELLEFCKSLGDEVVVGLNSDSSVKKLRGNDRPIFNQEDRKKTLESIRFVDKVVIFEEDTPYSVIKSIKPDIIVKGGDYSKSEVVGADLCKVLIFEYIDGYSTTKAIKSLSNR